MHLYGIIIEEITNGQEPKISSKTWKLTFKCSYIDEDQEEVVEKKREEFGNIEAKMNLELHEIEEGTKYLVSVSLQDGSSLVLFQTFEKIEKTFINLYFKTKFKSTNKNIHTYKI